MKIFFVIILLSLLNMELVGAEDSEWGNPDGQWVIASLDQIELTPAEGWFTGEGVWFANPLGAYQTKFNCSRSQYIAVKNAKLADRALSLAMYAKSTAHKIKVFVVGCDKLGYLEGRSVMMVK